MENFYLNRSEAQYVFGPCWSMHPTQTLPLQDTDVLHMKVFSTDFIILTSFEAISDLLEKRSSIYSDRVGHPSFHSPAGSR